MQIEQMFLIIMALVMGASGVVILLAATWLILRLAIQIDRLTRKLR